ncbi:MAG: hypothetical protein QJR02_11110 [Sinobacteraceae bacterium]|nr:hypothetical protein [Nevskiaceae bacterium]
MSLKYFAKRQMVLVLLCLVTACAPTNKGGDASITFHDGLLKDMTLTQLRAAGIPFELRGDTIWYSVKYEDRVEQISQKVIAGRPLPFGFSDRQARDHFADILKKKGFEVMLRDSPNLYSIYVPHDKYQDASKILQDFELNEP